VAPGNDDRAAASDAARRRRVPPSPGRRRGLGRRVVPRRMNYALFESDRPELFNVRTRVRGPVGSLPFTEEQLRERPSGDLCGWSQNVGMGWRPEALRADEFLLLSTHGGIRAPDGTPIALGYHTGHWEVGLLLERAAHTLRNAGAIPFAASC